MTGCTTRPRLMICSTLPRTESTGMAKPTPEFAPAQTGLRVSWSPVPHCCTHAHSAARLPAGGGQSLTEPQGYRFETALQMMQQMVD